MNQVSDESLIEDILFEGISTVADRRTEPYCFGTPGVWGGRKKYGGISPGRTAAKVAPLLGRISDALIDFHEMFRVYTLAGDEKLCPAVPKQPKKVKLPQGRSEAGGAPSAAFRVPCCSRGRAMPG